MTPIRLTDQFKSLLNLAIKMSKSVDADGVLLMADGPADWSKLKRLCRTQKILLAADLEEHLAGADEAGFERVILDMPGGSPIYERLTQALLEAIYQHSHKT